MPPQAPACSCPIELIIPTLHGLGFNIACESWHSVVADLHRFQTARSVSAAAPLVLPAPVPPPTLAVVPNPDPGLPGPPPPPRQLQEHRLHVALRLPANESHYEQLSTEALVDTCRTYANTIRSLRVELNATKRQLFHNHAPDAVAARLPTQTQATIDFLVAYRGSTNTRLTTKSSIALAIRRNFANVAARDVAAVLLEDISGKTVIRHELNCERYRMISAMLWHQVCLIRWLRCPSVRNGMGVWFVRASSDFLQYLPLGHLGHEVPEGTLRALPGPSTPTWP
jgi:hypothetical protein